MASYIVVALKLHFFEGVYYFSTLSPLFCNFVNIKVLRSTFDKTLHFYLNLKFSNPPPFFFSAYLLDRKAQLAI